MDKKLMQTYGEEILCYRLRSARQKKRAQFEDFHKHLIRLHKEDRALALKKRNLGWEPLVPPIQNGWKRFFVLREDVARSKHAPFFENILKKINTRDWSHRKDFMVKYRRFGKKKYRVKGQKLLQPDLNHFAKLEFTDEEKQFFHPEYFYEKWRDIPMVRFVFNEPWRFVLRVRPHLIDKVRVLDSEIESRRKEIDNYLDRNYYDHVLYRILHGHGKYSYWKDYEKEKEKNPLKHKPLHRILDELKDELL